MSLPRKATLVQVFRALCATQSSTLAERVAEYRLASVYNDWHFSLNPITSYYTRPCSELTHSK